MLLLIGPAGASFPAVGDIEVTGEVDGLYPGVMKTLDARVTNPQPFTGANLVALVAIATGLVAGGLLGLRNSRRRRRRVTL
jgi:hypothetical protein